ncbi:MAG: hypothetical protein OXF54_22810 [Caldilineaceae bacterium]|nr:hypothetical protein [Caldilineaceae bacterium]
MGKQTTALRQEAEEHLRTFGELAKRTVGAAWLSEEELQKFSDNVTGEIQILTESFKSSELLSASLYMMRRLACHVNIGAYIL